MSTKFNEHRDHGHSPDATSDALAIPANVFDALLAFFAMNSTVPDDFPIASPSVDRTAVLRCILDDPEGCWEASFTPEEFLPLLRDRLPKRLWPKWAASAIEAQRTTTVQQGVVHESAVPERQTPEPGPRGPDNG